MRMRAQHMQPERVVIEALELRIGAERGKDAAEISHDDRF